MKGKINLLLASVLVCLSCARSERHRSQAVSAEISETGTESKAAVENVLRKVADWQISYYDKKLEVQPGPGIMNMANKWDLSAYYDENGNPQWPVIEWIYSTFYTGLYKVADLLKEKKYSNELLEYAKKAEWQVGKGQQRFFADHYLIGYLYCKLYAKYKDPEMIDDFRQMADELITRDSSESLELNYETMNVFREWAYADAMFVGPPSLFALANVTKENKYRDLADSLFWNSYDYIYDKNEHLYYRDSRYFTMLEKNGAKVFWSRGNGWVIAGLARILEELPENYPTRNRYETLFKEMATKIASLQQPDGMWRSGLLDPKSYPQKETSGTAFHCYGLAWGVNHGLLDKKIYVPVALKSWEALRECIHSDGKLGYVQKVGEGPGETTYEDTAGYGVGAFLLAGTEIMKLK